MVVVTGDFNLDFAKKYAPDYANRYLFKSMENYVDELGLEQLVEFQTWSRLVNGSLSTSVLDQI